MRVTSESNSGPPSRTPSIMDSPTLARVERARLRQEADGSVGPRAGSAAGGGQREDSLERCLLDPKYVPAQGQQANRRGQGQGYKTGFIALKLHPLCVPSGVALLLGGGFYANPTHHAYAYFGSYDLLIIRGRGSADDDNDDADGASDDDDVHARGLEN
uniref:Uncharacterized protein n=1 Tax=Anopheles atroparvus TaxID=41427 RepID=A0A182JBE6_ANOAO